VLSTQQCFDFFDPLAFLVENAKLFTPMQGKTQVVEYS